MSLDFPKFTLQCGSSEKQSQALLAERAATFQVAGEYIMLVKL